MSRNKKHIVDSISALKEKPQSSSDSDVRIFCRGIDVHAFPDNVSSVSESSEPSRSRPASSARNPHSRSRPPPNHQHFKLETKIPEAKSGSSTNSTLETSTSKHNASAFDDFLFQITAVAELHEDIPQPAQSSISKTDQMPSPRRSSVSTLPTASAPIQSASIISARRTSEPRRSSSDMHSAAPKLLTHRALFQEARNERRIGSSAKERHRDALLEVVAAEAHVHEKERNRRLSERDEDLDSAESDFDESECERLRHEHVIDMDELERQFMLLKNQLHRERSAQVEDRLAELRSPERFEVSPSVAGLRAKAKERIMRVEILRDLRLQSAQNKYEGELRSFELSQQSEKELLVDALRAEIVERMRALTDEHTAAKERLTTPHKPGPADPKGAAVGAGAGGAGLGGASLLQRPGEPDLPLHLRTNLDGGAGMGAAGAMARGVKRERDDSTPGAHALEAAGEPDEDCDPINGLRKRKKPQLVTGPYIVYRLLDKDILEDCIFLRKVASASPTEIAMLLPCIEHVRPPFELPARHLPVQAPTLAFASAQSAAFGMVGSVLGATTQIIVPQNSI